jgi:hypothetical protein
MSDKEPVVDLHEVEDYHNLIEVDAIYYLTFFIGFLKKKKKKKKKASKA